MQSVEISVVIPAIGRTSLNRTVASALREQFRVIVVSDGVDLKPDEFPCLADERVQYLRLGRNFGMLGGTLYYGQIAMTAGFFLSSTEFTAIIGDDDEFVVGAGDVYRDRISSAPDVDIWIPTLLYNDGNTACGGEGALVVGNVSHPMYRTTVFASNPMYHVKGEDYNISDYHHLVRCHETGYSIRWICEPCVLIRPCLPGPKGHGNV